MDIQLLYGIIGLLGGVLVGGIAVWWLIQQRLAEKENLLRENYTQLAVAQQKALVIPSLQHSIKVS